MMKFPADLLSSPPTASQRTTWEGLDDSARKVTRERLEAIRAWEKRTGGIAAKEAAKRADVGLSRFYKMAAEWRETGDLEALGTIKARQGRRSSKLDGEVVNALQSVVAGVVARNEDASVSKLVRLMLLESGVEDWKPPRDIPSKMKLREIVETELRRSAAMMEAGHIVAFDCCALNWAASPTSPFCVFMVLDRGTRAILGYHVGLFDEDMRGHAAAAAVAVGLIERLNLPWARDMLGLQIVMGTRRELYDCLTSGLETDFSISAKTASSARRFGRYILELVGPRLGQVVFAPKATDIDGNMIDRDDVDALMPKVNGRIDVRSRDWVVETMDRAAREYNETEIGPSPRTQPSSDQHPPARLLDVLRRIAATDR